MKTRMWKVKFLVHTPEEIWRECWVGDFSDHEAAEHVLLHIAMHDGFRGGQIIEHFDDIEDD